MLQPPTTTDANEWHRYFAMLGNNRAWELTVQEARTPVEDRELLDLAHASAWHWAQVGNELNRMRALMLLAEAHALAGDAGLAFDLAQEMRAWFLGRETPDWEVAFTHAIHAHCAHRAGHAALHGESYLAAAQALAAIGDEEDRDIVARTFAHVPRP
ncbi:MAG: hypothetical protein ABIP29_12510 [Candidatus Eisenbacteria bacterium]